MSANKKAHSSVCLQSRMSIGLQLKFRDSSNYSFIINQIESRDCVNLMPGSEFDLLYFLMLPKTHKMTARPIMRNPLKWLIMSSKIVEH